MELNFAIKSLLAIEINKENCCRIKRHEEILKDPANWHFFMISNIYDHDWKKLLADIITYNHQLENLIPLGFKADRAGGGTFFARNCEDAILFLCSKKLLINYPRKSEQILEFKIILRYTTTETVTIDVTSNLENVLKKHVYDTDKLNLTKFHKDPNLAELFLLTQPKIMCFVLHHALNVVPLVKFINLSSNNIKSLQGFLCLKKQQCVISLDLSRNLLSDLDELKFLKEMHITDLWLEGNPLCEDYEADAYVEKALNFCPHLEKLDGILIKQNGVVPFRRNFVSDKECSSTVDNFLKKYFDAYDSRKGISALYHKDALLTINNYTIKCLKRYSETLIGAEAAGVALEELPKSEHDPFSFTVDVVQFVVNKCMALTVCGVFRELPKRREMKIISFNRMFIVLIKNGEISITNEQFLLTSALKSQKISAFKVKKPFQPSSQEEVDEMVKAFSKITTLDEEWSKMLLEDCHNDMKSALEVFLGFYIQGKIPREHLLQE